MRFQLALNVRNLDEAIPYYSKLLGAPVNKRKPGYANFAVDSPPIKLVLFEAPEASERLNHVGFEMDIDNKPKLRAFDKRNGRTLWEFEMPANPHGNPMTYLAGGKQFIAVTTGRGSSAELIALALP